MKICVFCGSSTGKRPEYKDAALALGGALAQRDIGLVYGGASVGLMGAVADGSIAKEGHVTGILPEKLANLELAHEGLSELRIVGSMHERKMAMADMADAFIALPGGLGTLEETFEILTWTQLGIHNKPLGLLNIQGYYDGLLGFLDHNVREGFVRPEHRSLIAVADRPDDLIDKLVNVELSYTPKWTGDSSIR